MRLFKRLGKIFSQKSKYSDELDAFNEEYKRIVNYRFKRAMFRVEDLDFVPSRFEFIYQSGTDDRFADADRFIADNLEQLRECFKKHGYRFVYFKTIGDELAANDELWRYYFPTGADIDRSQLENLDNDFLIQHMVSPEKRPNVEKPAFVRFFSHHYKSKYGEGVYVYGLNEFDFTKVSDISLFVDDIVRFDNRHVHSEIPLLALAPDKDKRADTHFDSDTDNLLREVELKIDQLRRCGVSEHVLMRLIANTKTEEGTLTISSDYRIFLTDFGNVEVQMTPLVKAVYFLFLRHPEGIVFKELSDYRDELAMIYDSIKSKKPFLTKIHRLSTHDESIIALTDPLNNSINEKCTRIKEAFLIHVHDYIASHYYVTGKRGEPKRIILNRNHVVWEK